MNPFKRVRRWLIKQAGRAVGLTFLPSWVRHTFMRLTWENLIADGLKGNATVYACMFLLNRTFPEPELWPWEIDDEQEVKATAHPWRELMRRPNEDMGEAELMQYTVTYAALSGNSYWWKQRDESGRVKALWPFHDGDMHPIPGRTSEEGLVAYYVLDIGDGTAGNPWGVERFDHMVGVAVPKSEIVHWKWMIDPAQPSRGIGALEAAAKDIDTANEIRSLIYSLLKNDTKPPIVVNLAEGEEFSEEKAERLRAQWKKRFGGENRGLPAFLEFGMTVKELGYNFQELEMPELRDGPDAAVCQGFGIHPTIVGALVGLKYSTYSNFEEARRALSVLTLVPLWRSFASEVTQAMSDESGYEDITIKFDLAQVEALQQNQNELWTRITAAWQSSLITRGEGRQALGYEAGPEDDVYLVPLTAVFESKAAQHAPWAKPRPASKNKRLERYSPNGNQNGRAPNGHKNGDIRLLEYKANTGVMVAFMLPADLAEAIALDAADLPEGSEPTPAGELHLTLLFLGEAEGDAPEILEEVVAAFAARRAPLSGRLNGFGRFTNIHREGEHAFYATFDAAGLPAFRQDLVDTLGAVGIESPSEHGFVPHITLAYLSADAPTPSVALPDVEITFTAITLAWGGRFTDYPLSGEKARRRKAGHLPYSAKAFPDGDGGAGRQAAPREAYQRQLTAVRKLRQVREALRPRMEEEVAAYFEEWAEAAVARVEAMRKQQLETAGAGTPAGRKELTDAEWDALASVIFGEEDEANLRVVLESFYVEVVKESWPVMNAMLGTTAAFDLTDPAVTQALAQAGTQVREISTSTRDQLRDLLQYGNEQGWSIEDLLLGDDDRPGIGFFIEETYKGRPETIARTELGTAQQRAAVGRYERDGIQQVIVMDNQFDNSDPVCTELDGTVQSLDWARANPLQHPRCVRTFAPFFGD